MSLPESSVVIAGQAGKYAVSREGDVWSCTYSGAAPGCVGGSHSGPWRKLRPRVGRRGYLQVKLARGKTHYVHDLVLSAFVGPRPPGKEACHGPGGRLDTRIENLRYGTHAENMLEALIDGGLVTKLSPSRVRSIRRGAKIGVARKTLAATNGVSKSAIASVVRKLSWKFVGGGRL
jgi:HNH endonuclease